MKSIPQEPRKATMPERFHAMAASGVYTQALLKLGEAKGYTTEELLHMVIIVAGPTAVKEVVEACGGKLLSQEEYEAMQKEGKQA